MSDIATKIGVGVGTEIRIPLFLAAGLWASVIYYKSGQKLEYRDIPTDRRRAKAKANLCAEDNASELPAYPSLRPKTDM